MDSMIGAHNTFTYLAPARWWMRLLTPFVKCQSKGIVDQALLGKVEVVDIRVRVYKGTWYVCHGLVRYYITLNDALEVLYLYNHDAIISVTKVRLLIEGEHTEEQIKDLNGRIEVWGKLVYPRFEFYEGRQKETWEQITTPKLPELACVQMVGSMQSWYGKICPWLWHRLHRKSLRLLEEKVAESGKLYLFDFL